MPFVLFVVCAVNPACSPRHVPPPSEAVRARLGRVAVQSAETGTLPQLAKPKTKGQAAAAGALDGMLATGRCTGSASGSAAGAAALVQLALLPVGAVAGGVVGRTQGTAKAEVEAAERALLKAFAEMNFQEAVRKEVVRAARRNTRHPIVSGDERGSDRRPDSVLEVNVLEAGLAGDGKKNAPMSMFLRVRVRLLDGTNGSVLYDNTWVQTSGSRTFKDWAAQDACMFRQELSSASRGVAGNIVEEVFLACPISHVGTGVQALVDRSLIVEAKSGLDRRTQ